MRPGMKPATVIVIVALPLAFASPSLAAEPDTAPRPATARHWYGGPILAADAASLGLAILAFHGTDNHTVAKMALGSFVLASPAIHAIHGNPHRALLSGVLRAALPLGLAVLAEKATDCSHPRYLEFCGLAEFTGGFVGGAALAIIADQLLARDSHTVAGEGAASRPASALALHPFIAPTRRGATAGFAATY